MSLLRTLAASALVSIALLAVPVSAAATAVQEAQALETQGRLDAALNRLDRYLAGAPQDTEAKFARALILAELKRTDEAIKLLGELTREYPRLPQPYENLAALYVLKGDNDKARDTLQAALAARPDDAATQESLGDVYLALAGDAYSRALRLTPDNQVLGSKLSRLNQLRQAGGNLATDKDRGPASQGATVEADLQAATTFINAWAQAWSSKDVEAYLSCYAGDFKPEGGISRSSWTAQRRERIGAAGHIQVQLQHPQVSRIDAHRLRVGFSQAYQSDAYSDHTDKVLELSDVTGGWKIVREALQK